MVLCSIALHASVVTGTCGDNLTWSYDTDTKALTIEGSGAMADYAYDYWDYNINQPWAQVRGDILSVSLPDGLTSIGSGAFYDCSSLTSITIPNSVTSIGKYAFEGCSSLTKTNYTGDIASWCNIQFANADANPISFSKNLYLNDVLVTDLVIPEGVTNVGKYAFYDCSSITSVTIPNSVTRIGSSAFHSCSSITSITIPNSVTSIGGYAFRYCSSLTSVTIPNSVTSIGGRAFEYCYSLTSIILPNSVTSIGDYAFNGCDSLTSITIPNSVTSIGEYAFCSCAQVTVECTTPPTIESGTFNSDATISVPCFTMSLYLATPAWQFLSIVDDDTYRVNLSATEGGKATITATDCDANTATIEAVADDLYQFSQWSDGNTDNPRTLTLTQDTTLQAIFGPTPSYSVTLRGNSIRGYFQYINDYGEIDNLWFNDDSEINITVREGLSVYFYENNMNCGTWLSWSDGVTDYERIITITSDTVITSLFDVITYQVSITAGENGSLSEEYNDVTLTDCDSDGERIYTCAYPDDGYYFAGWSDGNTERCRTFTITQDTTITALFEEIKYYSVTLRGNHIEGDYQYINDWGDIENSWFSQSQIIITVREGLSVNFYESNMGCGTWLGWSDGVTDNERTITITSDTVITSLFDVPTYQVNISAAEHGSLTQYGEPIDNIETTMTDCDSDGEWIDNICAVPDEGYYFTGWSDGYAYACRGIKVVSDTTLVAHFAEKHQVQVLVGVEPACKNMGTVSGSGIFYQSDVVTITATPNEGYHFVEWSDGNSIANREIYLTSDTTLFATFSAGDMGGKCGDNLYWTWDNGALTITGTGKMDLQNHPAWRQYEEIQITSVSMPEGMTSISSNAFEGYSIATIIVPASVEEVGDRAFADNDQLTHFEYLGNNIHWGTEAEDWYWDYMPLYGCRNLQYFRGNLELGEDYCTMSDTVIISNGQALDSWYDAVYVDNTNASDSIIRGEYDYVNAVRTLYLPAGLVEIGDYALQNARFLGGITIPEGVTRIGISAFEDCRSMDSVVFAGNNVETIGEWAFYNCHSLRSLTLPEGIEEVGLAAFYGCTYLKELTIPSTMKKIADNGFAGCEKMQTMYVNALVPPTIEAKTFEDVDRATPVFVPKGTLERYQADEYWSEFFNMAEYEAPTGNLNTAAEDNGLRKVVRDGQVLIIRGDKTYTILGETIQ